MSCTDGVLNGNETDLDCGGGCPPCPEEGRCQIDRDCLDGSGCAGGQCFNIEVAQESIPFLALYLTLIGFLLCFYLSCDFRARRRQNQKVRSRPQPTPLESGEIELGGLEPESTLRAKRWRAMFLPRLITLYRGANASVGRVRQEAAILNVKTSLPREERLRVTAKLLSVSLMLAKEGTLGELSHEEVTRILTEVEEAEKTVTEAFDHPDLEESHRRLENVERVLEKVVKRWVHPPIDLKWELADPELIRFQEEVEEELDLRGERKKKIPTHRSFVSAVDLDEMIQPSTETRCKVFLTYPLFYITFFGGMLAVALAFLVKIGSKDNGELQEGGLLGETFLPVPGYYNLAQHSEQRVIVPLLYAVMHSALYCFCWLPVPFWRGIWRDLSSRFPSLRNFLPIDDMVFFHKFLAVTTFSLIITGAILFLSAVATPCLDDDAQSCLAFDPRPVPGEFYTNEEAFEYDPFTNVLALRKLVFLLWFPLLPLLHWARETPKVLPKWVQNWWYEICYYTHIGVAHFSLVTVMICRFDVFYLALITWGLYYLDKMREVVLGTYSTEIVVRPLFGSQEDSGEGKTSVIHTDAKGIPTSMKLLIEVPPNFKISAGQWIYLRVPEISRIEWHPFSLACASRDPFLELQVGIIGEKDGWQREENRWQMVQNRAFTYRLYELLHRRITEMAYLHNPEREADDISPIRCQVRGPYGSSFTKAFDPHYTGAVIIGAGTGLPSALSVLREVLYRRKRGDRVPKYIWFVWSCKRVDDLLWCWETLSTLLSGAIQDGIIKPGRKWTPNSNMLDWLGVTIYVTQGDRALLQEFLQAEKSPVRSRSSDRSEEKSPLTRVSITSEPSQQFNGDLHEWLAHERRLLTSSMDSKETHIGKLLAWARTYLNRKAGRGKKMAVCFCGPTGLAHTISSVAREVGSGMEFSADHQ